MRFVDTNVLVYAVSALREDIDKRDRAIALLKNDDLTISIQVLQEFYVRATNPNRWGTISEEEALDFVATIEHIRVYPITIETFHSAVAISRRYQLSYWDGAILASALSAGCDAVYSEDMSPTQDYGGVRVINPFVSG